MSRSVVVGTLADWPLAPRIAKLISLPPEAYRVPCHQVVGDEAECQAVHDVVFKRKETLPPALKPASGALLGLLGACTLGNPYSDVEASWGYHGSATLEQVRSDLSKSFEVRTPAEDLAARRPKPATALKAIAKALSERAIPQRKTLMTYLEGGPFREGLLSISASDLAYGFVTPAECFGPIDRRLFFLWARCASFGTSLPSGDSSSEFGFDRFGAYVDELVAVGADPEVALDYVLDSAQSSRWWTSTAVRVWEDLALDRAWFIKRVLSRKGGAGRLADLLMSVLWLPEKLLDAGGRALMREVCASSLIPDATFVELTHDNEAKEALGAIERPSKATRRSFRSSDRRVSRLVPFAGEAETEAELAKLGSAVTAPARRYPKAFGGDSRAGTARAKRVTAALKELLQLAGGRSPKPATAAQLARLERSVGSVPPELRAYFSVAANLDVAVRATMLYAGDSLISLGDAVRLAKELRTYDPSAALVPLIDYRTGDFACFDVESSTVVYWDHEARGTTKLHADLPTALERMLLRPLRAVASKSKRPPKKTTASKRPPKKTTAKKRAAKRTK